jgi:hypothetical protein
MGDTHSPRAFLASTPLASLCKPRGQNVVVLQHNQTVGEALQVLAKHKILSAPLLIYPGLEDEEGMEERETSPQLLGWIDIVDLLRSLVERECVGGSWLRRAVGATGLLAVKGNPHVC